MSQRLSTVIIALLPIFALLAIGVFGAPWTIRTIVLLFAMLVAADALAHARFPMMRRAVAFAWGTVASLAVLMIIRTLWFYIGWNLNGWGHVVPPMILVVLATTSRIITHSDSARPLDRSTDRLPTARPLDVLLPLLSVSGFVLIAFAAFRAGTAAAIRTPWPLLPSWTLPVIGVLFVLPIVSAWQGANRWLVALQSACALAAVTVLAPLVYAIGYGFDGFLHVAGERVLFETGALVPKPMYYIGQYVTTTWIANIGELDIAAVDRWLVPVVSALLIPFTLASSVNVNADQSENDDKPSIGTIAPNGTRSAPLLAATAFLLPISAFITTTPNGFAMTLAAIALIAMIGVIRQTLPPLIPLVFALWSALTHPLIGLPVFVSVVAATIAIASLRPSALQPFRSLASPRIASILRIGALMLAALSGFTVPIVFGLASAVGAQGTNFAVGKLADASAWNTLVSSWIPLIGNHYALWADAGAWIEKLLPLIVLLYAVIGTVSAIKQDRSSQPDNAPSGNRFTAVIYLASAGSAAAAAILLHIAGDFGFLIDYERGNYAARLWTVAWILLLPVALPAFAHFAARVKHGPGTSVIGVLLSLAVLAAGSAYAALPRHDAVTPSRGWSVSETDINAVKLIDHDANGEPYTVLANQSVSAAAVRTFGFKRYNDDVFFYPIPTGGELYNVFLTASYGDPSRATMEKAATLGGSNLVYFVVNDYWWKSDELIEAARATADRTFTINDGKATVFKYEVK